MLSILIATALMMLSGCQGAKDTPVDKEQRLTPFGYFPSDCVRDVARGTTIRAHSNGTFLEVVETATGRVLETHAAKPHCVAHAQNVLANRHQQQQRKAANNNNNPQKKSFVGEDDGWLDFVEYTPTKRVGFFEGTYTVPADPPTNDDQVLFYFVGTENLNSEGGSVTILQPVLTWGNGHEKWNMASWNCCPVGEAQTSDFITHLEAGETVYGNISIDYENQVASVYSVSDSDAVDLTISGELRQFNWMDVTLEVYSVASCDEFASSDMAIDTMSALADDGTPIDPVWQDSTGITDCGGAQTFTETTWAVHHDTTTEINNNNNMA